MPDDPRNAFWETPGHSDIVTSVALSPDGAQVLTGSRDGTAKLWDIGSGAVLSTFNADSDSIVIVSSVAFSLDGSRVLTVGTARTPGDDEDEDGSTDNEDEDDSTDDEDGTSEFKMMWDAVTGELLQTLRGQYCADTSVAFSSDGRQVLKLSDDGTAKLCEAGTGRVVCTFGHLHLDRMEGFWETGRHVSGFVERSADVTSVAISPDGDRVLTGSEDGTAKLWDARTGEVLRSFGRRAEPWSPSFFHTPRKR
jgi:WD40 repeat protein